INNDGLPDIYFTSNSYGHNKLYLNKGNYQFEDITAKAGVAGTADWCTGATMVDINGDGLLDIYVCAVADHHGLKGHNMLFINNGNNTFTESAAKYGLDFSGFSTQAAFFDYDHDGDLDCYILNQSQYPSQNLVDTSHRRLFDKYAGDRLFRNDLNTPAKKFTDVTAQAGIYESSLGFGLGISVADFNNDGWDDIYIGNDFHENDYYYLNNGNGTFTESGAKHFNHYSRFSMGNDAGDFNNDGQQDVVTVDMLPDNEKVLKTYGSDENPNVYNMKIVANGYQYQYSKNCLQRNNGNGSSFSETALLSGVSATDWSWAPLFADFDNDGNKDLFISSGIVKRPVDMDYIHFVSDLYVRRALNTSDKYDSLALSKMPDGSSHPYLYRGDGHLSFTDVSDAWGTGDMKGYYNGAAYADLNNDGNLDMVVNVLDGPALILKNNTTHKDYLTLAFKGDNANTFGIGSKAYIFQKGKMQMEELMGTRGFQSSCDLRLHFGLDTTLEIDSMLIIWPDQKFQILKNFRGNRQITLYQKDAAGKFDYARFFKPQPVYYKDITDSLKVKWKHQEDYFSDFNVQYLIPHEESTRGPKIAVGDVNGDGLDDFYACGAKGQPGTLMIQQPDGKFLPADTALFARDAGCEDVDALFFDANGDGKPDLYVVSGGNEYTGNSVFLPDRLFINQGNGVFTKSVHALPDIFENKSCVAAADVDHDGDQDVFVGTLADATAYGIPQTSHLLLNDGKGNFTIAPTSVIDLNNIGMVTSAAFADVNHDGWPDLIVTGEWMPMTIFINHHGKFEKTVVPRSSGWWQTVYVDDVNGDGNPDILAGNWGWNNKFWSQKDGPVRLYVNDFDRNGTMDQLLSYTSHGIEYPFLAKDEVERELPELKTHYPKYSDYAGVPMKDVFYGWVDTVKPLVARRLGSAVFYGDGKGDFTAKDLPIDLQLAPVMAFTQSGGQKGGTKDFLLGGNFFDVIPYEGRYDAQPMALFRSNRQDSLTYIPQENLAGIKGQVRDLKWIRTAKYGKVLMVARNNAGLLFFSPR
ncbi:MAG: VCBS repeat-containing protein, partial [Bacteroidota bacterium]|nr:VCBS repeat-containing protein [Bacteroidota bacterium]